MKKENLRIPFLMALALLTRLPVTKWLPNHWKKEHQGLSTLWYPVVGLLLATLLYFFFSVLPVVSSPLVSSVLIVSLWVTLTGALHLDGLADSIDAAFFAHSVRSSEEGREQTLSIFKDPTAGPMAVVGIVLTLLLKTMLLSELFENLTDQLIWVFILALALPRTLALLLIITTPYVRPNGIGQILVQYTPVFSATWVILTVIFITLLFMPLRVWFALVICLGLLFLLWRKFWLSKIGGFVGDCVGALIELGEVAVLLVLYFANV